MSVPTAGRGSTVPNEQDQTGHRASPAPAFVSLLDDATLTVNPPNLLCFHGSLAVSLVEGCGEGSIYWRNPPENHQTGIRGQGTERATQEADRRARAQLRRYCVRNGLNRLGTLTYSNDHLPDDLSGVWADIERFRRRLHDELGELIPIVVTVEQGEISGRLHVHFAFGQYLDHSMVERAWSLGFVSLNKIKVEGGKREKCRRAAAYVSKYVAKDQGTELRCFNGRRYSTTKGFQAVRRSFAVDSFQAGLDALQLEFGGLVVWFWSSEDFEDWNGPPVWSFRFGDEPSTAYSESPAS